MRALIEMDLNEIAAKMIGESVYYDSLYFPLAGYVDQVFDKILRNTKFPY